jgi:hypothetical protein
MSGTVPLIQASTGVVERRTIALRGDDDLILAEARERFKRAYAWERTARNRWKEDYRFSNADSDNQWQWPATVYQSRTNRPCLTINKTRQHNLQIINDARQNKAAIKIVATGGDATSESASIYEGLVRHIEYISDAAAAYDMGTSHQVQGGIGYWRLRTDYVDENTLDQDILIEPIPDPCGVLLDCDIQRTDGSDAMWGFVFTDPSRERVEAEYPQFRGRLVPQGTGLGDEDNISRLREDTIRQAEYFRVVERPDTLYVTASGQTIHASDIEDSTIRKSLEDDPDVRHRKVRAKSLQWFKIVGDEIVDRRPMPGPYVPIVRCVGEETVIDGEMDRKGHTRALKDAQRMYNYNRSAEVEFGALQTKTPWIAPAAAIEGTEVQWASANVKNYSVLTFKHRDEEGKEIPPPTRPDPPQAAPAFESGAKAAADDMMMVSGQYQAMMGAPSNERSGVAIERRQREGDNSTYHYIEHQAQAIRYTGRIIVAWVPEVYDTERVVRILAEDGSDSQLTIDPTSPQAAMSRNRAGQIQRIFNPSVGRYEVQADVGKGWGTLRQEASDTILELMQVTNGAVFQLAGDILLRNMDFPGAEELADRFKNMIPPQALGGQSQEWQKVQQQLQQVSDQLQKSQQALANEKLKNTGREARTEIDAYDAETRRAAALKELLPVDEGGVRAVVRQVLVEMLGTSLRPATAALAPGLMQAAMATPQGPMPTNGNGAPASPGPPGGPPGPTPGPMPPGPPPPGMGPPRVGPPMPRPGGSPPP